MLSGDTVHTSVLHGWRSSGNVSVFSEIIGSRVDTGTSVPVVDENCPCSEVAVFTQVLCRKHQFHKRLYGHWYLEPTSGFADQFLVEFTFI